MNNNRIQVYLNTRRMPQQLPNARHTRLIGALAERRAKLALAGQPVEKLAEFKALAKQLEK